MPQDYQSYGLDESLSFESKWDREQKERQQRIRLHLANNLQLDPERGRRISSISALTGLPDEVIDSDLEGLESKVKADQFDYDKYLRDSPVWTEFASKNKYHLSVLEESQKEMGGMERSVNAIGHAWDSGWAMTELGNLRSEQMNLRAFGQELSPEKEKLIEDLQQFQVEHNFGATNWFAKFLVKNAKMAPTTFYSMGEALDEAALGAATYGTVAMGITGATGGVTAPGIIPAMGLGAAHGMLVGGGEAAYRLERGLAYDQFLEMGIPEEEARRYGDMTGLVNGALEMIGFNAMTKLIPGFRQAKGIAARQLVEAALKKPTMLSAMRNYTARYGQALGTEVVTEVLQETSNMVFGGMAKAEQREQGNLSPQMMEMTWDEIKDTWVNIALETLQGAAIVSSVGPTYNFYVDLKRAQKANEEGSKWRALGAYTKEAKAREEAPEKWREWLNHLTERGDVKEVRIDGEGFKQYWQSQKLDPEEVAAKLGVTIPSDEALDTDVVIPLEAYAEYLAATEHHNGLVPDMRLHAGDGTQREAARFFKEQDKAIAEMEQALGENLDRSALDQIEQDVLEMLKGDTKYNQAAAAQMAKLHAAVIHTQATAAGIDPLVLSKQTLAAIRGEVPESLQRKETIDMDTDPILDRIRDQDFPPLRDIYGASLIDMFREMGGIQDEGTELSSRDFGKSFVGVISKEGLSFDGMAEVAFERGYIDEYDQTLLQEAIDKELSGEQVFSRLANVNETLREQRALMEQTEQWFAEEGIDLNQMSNADVMEALKGIKTLDQSSQSDLEAYTRLLEASMQGGPEAVSAAWQQRPRVGEEQDFSSITFTDRFVDEHGKTGTFTESAQDAYDAAVNERNLLNQLMDCVNG